MSSASTLLTHLCETNDIEGDGHMFGNHHCTHMGMYGNSCLYKSFFILGGFLLLESVNYLLKLYFQHCTSPFSFVVCIDFVFTFVATGLIDYVCLISSFLFVFSDSAIWLLTSEL